MFSHCSFSLFLSRFSLKPYSGSKPKLEGKTTLGGIEAKFQWDMLRDFGVRSICSTFIINGLMNQWSWTKTIGITMQGGLSDPNFWLLSVVVIVWLFAVSRGCVKWKRTCESLWRKSSRSVKRTFANCWTNETSGSRNTPDRYVPSRFLTPFDRRCRGNLGRMSLFMHLWQMKFSENV